MAQRQGSDDVLVQVCIECGREYMYEQQEEPPADLACEKCGNTVFRSFVAATVTDDVMRDYTETTERDTGTEDGATEVTPGDLHDLGNL